MNTTCRTSAARKRCSVLLVSLATAATLIAQTAPVSPAMLAKYDANKNGVLDPAEVTAMQAGESGNTILMNPFEVNTEKDRGYAAGNTLSGGRADTPLAITPASISVMTREFLEDFDLTDMNQAAAWTVGMDAAEGGESGAFGGNRFQASFRGAGTGGNFPVRDGSINYYVSDSYNTERLDFSRGPNAALFGDGGPGGLQGSSSKQARLNSRATSVSMRVDTFGGYRTTLDTNYGLERVALRLNFLRQEIKAFQDGTNNTQNGFTGDLTFKISDNTQFRAQIERDAESNVAYRRTYGEQASRWDRTRVNDDNTAIANFANFGLGQISATNDYLVWNFGTN
ncbi:MAG: TonB-dependent receptor plug domain-containing protein, partial [Opitutaceae bacterium]